MTRWRMRREVKARARHRCEIRLLGVCDYWGKGFHQIVTPPQTPDDLVYTCRECSQYVSEHREWAESKGLLNRTL